MFLEGILTNVKRNPSNRRSLYRSHMASAVRNSGLDADETRGHLHLAASATDHLGDNHQHRNGQHHRKGRPTPSKTRSSTRKKVDYERILRRPMQATWHQKDHSSGSKPACVQYGSNLWTPPAGRFNDHGQSGLQGWDHKMHRRQISVCVPKMLQTQDLTKARTHSRTRICEYE